MLVSTLEEARAFLGARRIAVVGVSREAREFSRGVFRELGRRGLDVVPVNPALTEAEGRPAFPRVQDVVPAPDAALLLVPPSRAEEAVKDCLAAGVRRVWFHRGAGRGSASAAALALCHDSGVAVVEGLCPFMALPGAGSPHRVHGFVRRALARPGASMERRGLLSLSLHAFAVWALCAATMGIGLSVTSLENALVAHLVGAPVFAAAVALVYFRRRDPWTPLATAAFVLSFIVVVDLVLVAGVINRSLDMFRSALGTWLPFALIFGATYVTGAAVTRARARAGGS